LENIVVALQNPLLARSSRIAAASRNAPPMRAGSQGEAVVRLQLALIVVGESLSRTTRDQSRIPDGIWGPETQAAVRDFQRSAGLVADGIVGAKTLGKLDSTLPPFRGKQPCCANSAPKNYLPPAGFRQALAGATFARPTIAGLSLPSSIRLLTSAQQSLAATVFGKSLNFSLIFLSNATGLGGRPFTVAVPINPPSIPAICIINAGTFSPSRDLLIHELTHVWQSQHSVEPTKFMVNSTASQAVADGLLSAFGVDASAYYYRPGKRFGSYGAEQIACQVEGGVASIVAEVAGTPPMVPNLSNELSLSVAHWETNGPGVVTTC
jgi:hypothetical protein